jgi:hypothetical protein
LGGRFTLKRPIIFSMDRLKFILIRPSSTVKGL